MNFNIILWNIQLQSAFQDTINFLKYVIRMEVSLLLCSLMHTYIFLTTLFWLFFKIVNQNKNKLIVGKLSVLSFGLRCSWWVGLFTHWAPGYSLVFPLRYFSAVSPKGNNCSRCEVTQHMGDGFFVIFVVSTKVSPILCSETFSCPVTITIKISANFLFAFRTMFLHLHGSLGATKALACLHHPSVSQYLWYSFVVLFYYRFGANAFLLRLSPVCDIVAPESRMTRDI